MCRTCSPSQNALEISQSSGRSNDRIEFGCSVGHLRRHVARIGLTRYVPDSAIAVVIYAVAYELNIEGDDAPMVRRTDLYIHVFEHSRFWVGVWDGDGAETYSGQLPTCQD
ncbi:hypothetical protein CALCODRAFT_503993 [Calocera cornea HHB12733]|uniref:Uncharacterized protein n=1 Tax=Calocera cornea HHB12733 TaxID=1353952 RepID=A0A165CMI2_9BASI|nr:hypothetical protein CALCODRAFT_503993 [Calocera cornea HHB12733]